MPLTPPTHVPACLHRPLQPHQPPQAARAVHLHQQPRHHRAARRRAQGGRVGRRCCFGELRASASSKMRHSTALPRCACLTEPLCFAASCAEAAVFRFVRSQFMFRVADIRNTQVRQNGGQAGGRGGSAETLWNGKGSSHAPSPAGSCPSCLHTHQQASRYYTRESVKGAKPCLSVRMAFL